MAPIAKPVIISARPAGACACAAPNPKAAALVKDGERLYKENKYKEGN